MQILTEWKFWNDRVSPLLRHNTVNIELYVDIMAYQGYRGYGTVGILYKLTEIVVHELIHALIVESDEQRVRKATSALVQAVECFASSYDYLQAFTETAKIRV